MIDTTKLQAVISKALADEWQAQGHAMTSKILTDMEYVVKQEVKRLEITGMMYAYGNIIARGVKPNRIPYGGGGGKGGTSLYITALQNYVKARMGINDEQKSKSIAFAIAKTHKKEGMPSKGSYAFSKNGRRLDWVEHGLKEGNAEIQEAIKEMVFGLLTVEVDVLVKKWNYELNS